MNAKWRVLALGGATRFSALGIIAVASALYASDISVALLSNIHIIEYHGSTHCGRDPAGSM